MHTVSWLPGYHSLSTPISVNVRKVCKRPFYNINSHQTIQTVGLTSQILEIVGINPLHYIQYPNSRLQGIPIHCTSADHSLLWLQPRLH